MSIDVQSLAAAASIAGIVGGGLAAACSRLLRFWKEWKERKKLLSEANTERVAAETDNFILGGAEAAVSALRDALSTEQTSNKELRVEVTDLRARARELEKTTATQERTICDLQDTITDQKRIISELTGQIQHLQAQLSAMNEDMKNLRNEP